MNLFCSNKMLDKRSDKKYHFKLLMCHY